MAREFDHQPDDVDALLRDADRAAPPPAVDSSAPLVDRVRRVAARRRRARRVAATSAAALAAAGGMWAVLATHVPPTPPPSDVAVGLPVPPPPGPMDRESMRARIVALAQEADVTQRTADALLAAERSRARLATATRRAAAVPDALADVRRERDAAALLLVYQADELTRENRREPAIAAYRRAVELFPQSPAAGVARERLRRLEVDA